MEKIKMHQFTKKKKYIICTIIIQSSQHCTRQKHNLFKLLFFLQLQGKKNDVEGKFVHLCHIFYFKLLNYSWFVCLKNNQFMGFCPTNVRFVIIKSIDKQTYFYGVFFCCFFLFFVFLQKFC